MTKQPRFIPTEDNNEVIIGSHTVELEVGKEYTKAALLKAFADVQTEEEVIEAVVADLFEDAHDETESSDDAPPPSPPADESDDQAEPETAAAPENVSHVEVIDVRVTCPKCGAKKVLPVPRDRPDGKLTTKCQRCNNVFEYR